VRGHQNWRVPTTGASTCHSSRQLQLSSTIPLLAHARHKHLQEAATASVARASTYGLLHHKEKDRNQGSTSEPVAAQPEEKTTNKIQSRASDTSQSQSVSQPDTHRSSKHMSGSESAAAALAESGGAFDILYQKPTEDQDKRSTFGRPNDASAPNVPSKSEKRRS